MTQDINAYVAAGEENGEIMSPETHEVAPGRAAQHQNAVQLIGPWYRIGDGFNEHVRRIALALSRAGEKVHLQATNIMFLGDGPDEGVSDEVRKLAEMDVSSFRALVYMTVYEPQRLRQVMTIPHNIGFSPQLAEHLRRQRVIYTVFERDNIPRSDAFTLSRAGQVWTACRDNADSLVRAGVPAERVRVIPCPFLPDDPLLGLRSRTRKPGPPRFYHIGKWEPRKAQDNIIRAFLRAFRPGEAQLYMRCNPMRERVEGYPMGPMEALALAVKEPEVQAMGWSPDKPAQLGQAIKIIDVPLPLPKLIQLHETGDVYVSLSRAEGFDMPAFDAKLAGNRLVYTETAARDFAAADDLCVPRSGTVDAHPMYKWEKATYGDYNIAVAAENMRAAARDVVAGTIDRNRDMSGWSAENVGRKMIDTLPPIGTM